MQTASVKGQLVVSIVLRWVGSTAECCQEMNICTARGAFLRYVLSVCEIHFSKSKIFMSEAFIPSHGNALPCNSAPCCECSEWRENSLMLGLCSWQL